MKKGHAVSIGAALMDGFEYNSSMSTMRLLSGASIRIFLSILLISDTHGFIAQDRSHAIFGTTPNLHPLGDHTVVRLSSSSSDGSNSKKNRSLSASEWARREEDKRRREREGDVMIGKTSAVPGAKDFELNTVATEEQWLHQATRDEQEIFRHTEEGLQCLKTFQLENAMKAFDKVFKLKPDAYLWQAGIADYYLGHYEEAADIFARSAAIFENKFFEPATEERIWRYACELKLLSSMGRKERKRVEEKGGLKAILTQLPEKESTGQLLRSERRKALRLSQELFAASIENDHAVTILSRAKLRSIAGAYEEKPKLDVKMWKLAAWFYLGLHYDAIGDFGESKKCMKMALRLCPSGNGSDIIHTLPMLHMSKREWFDDDSDFEKELFESHDTAVVTGDEGKTAEQMVPKKADPVQIKSIKSSISKMRLQDLQEALRMRGLKIAGSKEELSERLFYSLMSDVGLLPEDAGLHP